MSLHMNGKGRIEEDRNTRFTNRKSELHPPYYLITSHDHA